ncbi:hypothetical protein AB0D38_21785 [Streptomyces sp. NPDC048279]|uniref:hypothetical protein n=1 Tax=Streptomyces sp. NPDC048279 TaxID=3154714 RepID=UPI00344171C5
MHQIDLPAEIARLRQLGSDFEDLHSEIRSLALPPGTDARQQLTAKIVDTNELVQQAMCRLAALDGSQYTAVPGSRPALEALASVVLAASLAACDLALALEANPLEGAPFPGPPGAPFPDTAADEAAVRTARHAEAVPAMAEHLANAAHQLDLAHTGCYYLASGITRDLKQHAEQNPRRHRRRRSRTASTPSSSGCPQTAAPFTKRAGTASPRRSTRTGPP